MRVKKQAWSRKEVVSVFGEWMGRLVPERDRKRYVRMLVALSNANGSDGAALAEDCLKAFVRTASPN